MSLSLSCPFLFLFLLLPVSLDSLVSGWPGHDMFPAVHGVRSTWASPYLSVCPAVVLVVAAAALPCSSQGLTSYAPLPLTPSFSSSPTLPLTDMDRASVPPRAANLLRPLSSKSSLASR